MQSCVSVFWVFFSSLPFPSLFSLPLSPTLSGGSGFMELLAYSILINN